MSFFELEIKYNFTYPALFYQLSVDGMLNWGASGPDWFEQVYPKLKDTPPLLFNIHDLEVMTAQQVDDVLERIYAKDSYLNINPIYRFIPLVQNGAGDYWCFLVSETIDGQYPIVFFSHDTDEATYWAKDLHDFIARMLLEFLLAPNAYDEMPDEEIASYAKALFSTHAAYLTEQVRAQIEGLMMQSVQGATEEQYLITEDEYQFFCDEYLNFIKKDQIFSYTDLN